MFKLLHGDVCSAIVACSHLHNIWDVVLRLCDPLAYIGIEYFLVQV